MMIAGALCPLPANDTCVVAVRIDNKIEPFAIKADAQGETAGMIANGLNGDVYLYTNKPYIKVVNESDKSYRDYNTGEYRVLFFDGGTATTYDYAKNKGESTVTFQPKSVKNFRNTIFFSNEPENEMWFQLEHNSNYRRFLKIREIDGEFGGLKDIVLTVAKAGKPDSLIHYADSDRPDSLVLYPGESVKKVSVTRRSNGVLNRIAVNGEKLPGKFSFRNSDMVAEADMLTSRFATLTTDEVNVEAPGVLSIEYSYAEGDGHVVAEHKDISLKVGIIPVEEPSKAWMWWLLAIVAIGGIGGYYYRRYQLKKRGIIPETDAEKVVRLTKEVAAHGRTIEELRKVESNLMSDKENLQKDVENLEKELSVSRNETLEKAAESDGFHNQLTRLQLHADEVQENLDEAKRQIAVYESGEEKQEINRLNQHIASLKEEHKRKLAEVNEVKMADMAALENKLNAERVAAIDEINVRHEETIEKIGEKNQEAIAALQAEHAEAIRKVEEEKALAISAVNVAKEQAISIVNQQKEEAINEANEAKDKAIAAAVAEKESTVAATLKEKEETLQAMAAKMDADLAVEHQRTQYAEGVTTTDCAMFMSDLNRAVENIIQQIAIMQQEITDAHYENNFVNVISHMHMKVLDFERWYQKEIVTDNPMRPLSEVRTLMQEQLLQALSNNYTWVAELVRFNCYCTINRQFQDKFRESGISTLYLRNAYAETVALFGRIGITLVVPCLFSDDFNPGIHHQVNAPLINNFFPHTFLPYTPDSKGMIYDVLRPGYLIEGEVKQLSEVCVY